MKPPRILAGLLLWVALTGTPSHAEKADRNKPMNVEADALRYDDSRQTSVFTGRVLVTKGSIQIRGARIEVRQDAEGHQYGVVQAEPGKLAFFRQKRDGLDEFIEGEAETIEYDGRADTVKFLRRAQLRRLRGTTLNDEINGSVILFDNVTEVFTVDGGATQGAPTAPGGRVRATLMPRAESPAAPAARPLPGTAPKPAGSPGAVAP